MPTNPLSGLFSTVGQALGLPSSDQVANDIQAAQQQATMAIEIIIVELAIIAATLIYIAKRKRS